MIYYSLYNASDKPGTKKKDIKSKKTYAVAQLTETLTLDEFAAHISEHGSVYGKADIAAVATLLVIHLREMLLEGKKVQLGDLGAFSPSIKSTGAVNASQFVSRTNITGVRAIWTPGKAFKNLLDDADFRLVPSRDAQAAAILEQKSQDNDLPGNIE